MKDTRSARIHERCKAAGLPVVSVREQGGEFSVGLSDAASPDQQAAADRIAAAVARGDETDEERLDRVVAAATAPRLARLLLARGVISEADLSG